jgi:hypothetical protein
VNVGLLHQRDASSARGGAPEASARAPFGPTLALIATCAIGCFLVVMSAMLLVVHPTAPAYGALTSFVNQQNQSAKIVLYVGAFALLLPAALIAVPRLADAIAAGPNGPALSVLSALLTGTLAATVIVVRVSHRLPWGDGLGVLLCASGVWCALGAATLIRVTRARRWTLLARVQERASEAWTVAAVLVFVTFLSFTHLRSLSLVGLVLAVVVATGVLFAQGRMAVPRLGRLAGGAVDTAVAVILLFAVVNVVVFEASSALPNIYFPPGVIQFQQDWILGPTNQLLGGGALLVNEPVSQYGVGLVYFLAGWFHLAPIGYGTFGLIDGLLSALVYVGGYFVLRLAGASRVLAAAALAFAVAVFIFNLRYPVGALPEQGPLRFGLPIVAILALLAGARWPRRDAAARGVALVAVGIGSVWALEAFAYTLFTFLAIMAVEARLRPAPGRRRWIGRQAALALLACVCVQLVLAAATLIGSGELPDWGQYLAYVHGLLLGGKEGSVTYGFDHWSPGLLVVGAGFVSAAAIVLLLTRVPALVARERTRLIAVAGTTAYAIAAFSYSDNRSSTYLLLYASLPILLTIVLWLQVLLASTGEASRTLRLSGLALALSVAAVMLSAAWPSIGSRFSQSALAHAYPGGGLRAALHRLWHAPPIDPRAPEGERLLARYMPGTRAVVLLLGAPDLGIETLMRSGRSSALFIGDPSEDLFVPSVWMPKVSRQIAELRAGQTVLVDRAGLLATAMLRGRSSRYPFDHPVLGANAQLEWILHAIDRRFALRPIYTDADGLLVARLARRT